MKTYLRIDHKHLDPKKDPWSSFDILASFPEMKKPKFQGGIVWPWWNMSEEKRRRSFAGADRGRFRRFRHDEGMDFTIWGKGMDFTIWGKGINKDLDIIVTERGCGRSVGILNGGFMRAHWSTSTLIGGVMGDELGERKRIEKEIETALRVRDDDFRERGDITRTVRASLDWSGSWV